MNVHKPTPHQICGVSFGFYNSDEIRELSVLQVDKEESFDVSGEIISGGLCDNVFGPVKKFDLCKTCGLNEFECPGHFGHIALPLPVFNPVLLKQLFQLLQLCCLTCDNFLVNYVALEITIAQSEALKLGFDHLIDELEQLGWSLAKSCELTAQPDLADFVRQKLEERIELESKNLKKEQSFNFCNVKNMIEKRQKLFKAIISGKLLKPVKKCLMCSAKKYAMNVVNNALIILSVSKASQSKRIPKNADINEEITTEVAGRSYITPLVARTHLRAVWNNNQSLMKRLFAFLQIDSCKSSESSPVDIFFLDVIPVSPNRFRPVRFLHGRQFENEKTASLSQIMITSQMLLSSLKQAKAGTRTSELTSTSTASTSNNLQSEKAKDIAKFHMQWQKLQILCNRLYDCDMDKMQDKKYPGIKQDLEKKEGLFRKHMMGKRVNYAARSVISPDPYIRTDEIGIPFVFATKLTYPQPVTNWNLKQLQEMVLNGPQKHPGAISVQFEDGLNIRLRADNFNQRKQIADRLALSSFKSGNLSGTKIVYRHLITGDVLLLNRQPTLHKPSIMAHVARVLPNEKTLRLHYSNCKCYNADFDGDEMNAHFPQSELARAEAYIIANVNNQYLVPKDGSPLSGLIQDHIIAGTLLTIRGRFFKRGDYQELLYSSLSFLNQPIKFLLPTIIKPKQLWSGKQIISSIVLNIVPKGKKPPTLSIASKINPKFFLSSKHRKWVAGGTPLQLNEMCDSQVIFRDGHLLCGIMDKSNLGSTPYGLIHCCYELYGGQAASALLTAFARLSTHYLQMHHGFTLGILDILVDEKANQKRQKYISKSESLGDKAVCEALGIDDTEDKREILEKMKNAYANKSDVYLKMLDQSMKSQTDDINNSITEVCLPKGLIKKFPNNNMQLMIQSGAKGGSVNAIQISCLLGQIELEGRRPPCMMSGRTLPSFRAYETSPRSGGFVAGRFMTGIRPQEFFFHCMAGREGLIDTAVKTSRSGYLQRCLIKHLEGIVVNYDLTVRDSDGSVIQLLYGEDGIDIVKSQLLKEKTLPMIIQNNDTLKPTEEEIKKLTKSTDSKDMNSHKKKIKKWIKKNKILAHKMPLQTSFLKFAQEMTRTKQMLSKDDLVKKWQELTNKGKLKFSKYLNPCPDPINNRFQSDVNVGAISEKLDSIIESYIKNNPHHLLAASASTSSQIHSNQFRQTVHTYYMKSLCHPGEAVGLLAAQSVGEPSTQMTLNTFHFAGRGEMNVTLGIPRLREILMTASASIATPSMDIPFLTDYQGNIEDTAEKVRLKINAVKLSDVIEFVEVEDKLRIADGQRSRVYDLKFNFLPYKYYKHKLFTNPKFILHFMESKFIKNLVDSVQKRFKIMAKSHGLFDHSTRTRATKSKNVLEEDEEGEAIGNVDEMDATETGENFEEEMSSEDEAADDEGDTTANKHKSRRNQEQEYEEPEEDEVEQIDSDIEEVKGEDQEQEDRDDEKSIVQIDDDTNDFPPAETDSQTTLTKSQLKQANLEAQKPDRQNKVVLLSKNIEFYDFDTRKEEWCQLRLKFDLSDNKLDMLNIIEEESKRAYLHKVGRIERAFLVKDPEAAKRGAAYDKLLKTEGVSLLDVVKYDDILDIKRIYSNDIHAIANTYGIEAAAKAIQREISNVFAVYGIQVDNRHLSLISDYMTFSGTIKGMNRMAMEGVAPIQAMTFETTTNFLKAATLIGLKDDLASPSARIVVGRPSLVGTGSIDALSKPISVPINNSLVHSPFGQSFGSLLKKEQRWSKPINSWFGKRKHSFETLNSVQPVNKRIKFN